MDTSAVQFACHRAVILVAHVEKARDRLNFLNFALECQPPA
jgi:hypothetical protein